jgi:NADH dehydrogenase FAD-containing subunit
MGRSLVLVGGGHAHLTCLLKGEEFTRRGHRVTVVSPSPYQYYSGMGPGMLGGLYRPQEIRFHVRRMAERGGAAFVTDTVVRVDPRGRRLRLASGDEIPYDVVSFNVGSEVPVGPLASRDPAVVPVKPVSNLLRVRQEIIRGLRGGSPRLLIVGGGPSGLEISGNLWRLVRHRGGSARITLVAGRKWLGKLPYKARRLARASLASRGIEILEGSRLADMAPGQATLEDGRQVPFDAALLAVGVRPPSLFRDSGLPVGEDGGLLVNARLQGVDHPEVFGGGDCISLQGQPLDKVGVYAVRQNRLLFDNLMAALGGGDLGAFEPGGAYLLIFNLGDGRGIYWKRGLVWAGRLAFLLKDRIDRRFMRRFQVSGELTEGQDAPGATAADADVPGEAEN